MRFVQFTRPDDSVVYISTEDVMWFAPVPQGATAGPLLEGTRIVFRSGGHQDVKERVDEVATRLNA